ncbi:MAG: TerC family protein [bacterium]
MHVAPWVWLLTVGVAAIFLVFDIFVIGRRPHEPTMAECARALALYVSAAVIFGVGVWMISGARYGGEFFAGWLTEYSLSIDNLFIFLLILGKFAVPRKYQQEALLIGIVLALIFRGVFIGLGAAVINNFSWIFYLFGLFLVYTAFKIGREGASDDDEYEESKLIAWAERRLPATDEYNGVKLTVKKDSKRLVTPMFFVLVALGTTDVLFALDSIPAIYGLTKEPYLVLMANIFALMGLRQLYFLIGGLLQRLVYLSIGLAFLLAFIGIKLILHALHENELPFINGGEHVGWAPDIPIWLSLVVIVGTLVVTAVASVLRDRSTARSRAAAEPAVTAEPRP